MLSDVYAPTIDTTNVETMQYIVTDGSTFTDLQTRDTTYTVASDATGMTCTVTSTAKSRRVPAGHDLPDRPEPGLGRPAHRLPAAHPAARSYHLYVRLDATVGGNGGGGSGNGGADTAVVDRSTGTPVPVSYDTVTATNAANRDYAVPSYLALRADRPFSQVSSGFVGTASDGLVQLDATHRLTADRHRAGRQRRADGRASTAAGTATFTLALGFGTTQAAAVAGAQASVRQNLHQLTQRYQRGWASYDRGLKRPARRFAGLSPQPGGRGRQAVLPVGQRGEGQRGQDLPRCDRGVAGLAVGPGRLGRRPGQHLLRLLPRGVRA